MRRVRVLVVALAVGLAGCGTRLSHQEVVNAGPQAATAAAGAGDTAPTGTDTGVGGAAGDTAPGGTAGPDDIASGGQAASTSTGAKGAAAAPGGSTVGPDVVVPSGSQVVIGTVGNFSGPAGAAYSPAGVGMQVWTRSVNSRGGVAGHPVKVIVRDDGGDPARYQAILQEMVDKDKVIAFVGNTVVLTGNAGRAYLEKNNIPLIGGDLSFTAYVDSPMYFPHGATLTEYETSILANGAHLTSKKRLGMITCLEAQACRDAANIWPGAAPRLGLDIVFRAQVSITQPSFTAECLGARQANVELFAVLVDPTALGRLANSCALQGFKPTYLIAGPEHSPSQDGNANLEGTLASLQTFPQVADDTLGAKAFHDAFNRYAPGTKLYVTHSLGWTSGELFGRAAEIAGPALTREKLVAALRSMKRETLNGTAVPLDLTKTPRKISCWFLMKFQGNRWTAPQGSKPQCPT